MSKRKEDILIGKKIRELRKEQGYSQEAFAAHVEIARGAYGRIERGEHNVSSRTLIRIARALSVEVGELFPTLAELDEA